MHYAIDIVPFGEYADPRVIVRMAVAAENAGWDGVFIWDHLGYVWGAPSADPWVTLAACAQATTRIKLGPAVTPLARHRPHLLAATLANLDILSGGRVIFGAGLGGVEKEFSAFGEPADARVRAEKLDEGLELIDRLLSGEPVTHIGSHYTADSIQLAPACPGAHPLLDRRRKPSGAAPCRPLGRLAGFSHHPGISVHHHPRGHRPVEGLY